MTQLTNRPMTTSPLVGAPPRRLESRGDFAIRRCDQRRATSVAGIGARSCHCAFCTGLWPTLRDETMESGRGSSRRFSVMPANAGIQNTTTLANFGCLLLSAVATLAPPRRVPLDTRFRGYDRGLTRTSRSCFLSAQQSNPGAASRGHGASLLARTIQIDRTSRRGVGPTPAHASASARSMASPNDSRRSSRPAGARNCTPVGIPSPSAPEGSESPHMRKRLPSTV